MPFITWDEKYSVGVTQFDAHHRQLIQIINTLHDAMKAGKGKEVLSVIFKQLLDYTQFHFNSEEMSMEKFAFADMATHKKEHQALVQKASDFYKKYQSGQVAISLDLMNFLNDWLTKHIQGCDKKYGPFFNSKGMK